MLLFKTKTIYLDTLINYVLNCTLKRHPDIIYSTFQFRAATIQIYRIREERIRARRLNNKPSPSNPRVFLGSVYARLAAHTLARSPAYVTKQRNKE